MDIKYLGGDIYGMNCSLPIKLTWGEGGLGSTLSSAKVQYSYATCNLKIIESNLQGDLSKILMVKNSWNNVF